MAFNWGFNKKEEKSAEAGAAPEPEKTPETKPEAKEKAVSPERQAAREAAKARAEAAAEASPASAPIPAVRRRVLILGEGFAAPLWADRLAKAGIDHVLSSALSPEEMGRHEFEAVIDTIGAPWNGKGWTAHHDAPESAAPALIPGGCVLGPCYGISPTCLAATMGELAPRTAGYALYPAPPDRAANDRPVIEAGRALQTSEDAWDHITGFLGEAGFRVEVAGDAPGFIFGRILACLINEAAHARSEGLASRADIDSAMKLGLNYPKGLFEWADELGLDLILEILNGLVEHYEEDRYRPAPLLRHMALAGRRFIEPEP